MSLSVGKKVAGAALAGTLALGGAGAIALAGGGQASSAASNLPATLTAATQNAPAKGRRAGDGWLALFRRADHGTLEVKNKAGQWVTYTFDKGKVTAVSASSITLARPDGQSVTIAITAETKFRGVSSAADVTVGRAAIVVSDNGHALWVAQRDLRKTPKTSATTQN